jgi:diaminohydroxyphosphoribosylaminopyrimidine deaminase/5-amino-6-(5-phosphoribosylamino)uracil reductase
MMRTMDASGPARAIPVRPAPFVEGATDRRMMQAALALARRGLGATYPNPSVAALVVRHEWGGPVIVGRGVTAPGGRPHAERIALRQAGDLARGATIYVTLEPCNRHSRSGFGPSCSDQIIAAGIARVVAASADPSPFADGEGPRRLERAGIEVTMGVLAVDAAALNRGHLERVRSGRPLVQLKLAVTADGFAAAIDRRPLPITGEDARRHVHMMRAEADAIMIGIGTALADDPELTCRLPGLADRSPTRVVLDPDLRLPTDGRLARGATLAPLWIFAAVDAPAEREAALRRIGAEVMRTPREGRGLALGEALALLGARGITRLMLEGGPTLAEAFAAADLLGEAHILTGPAAVGAGVPAIGPALGRWLAAHPPSGPSRRLGVDTLTIHEAP